MPENYILLERTELNASAASVTFANIPQTGYTDLKIVASIRGTDANNYVNNRITFNGSTSGYTSKLLYGLGSSTGSLNNSVTNAVDFSSYGTGSSATANTFGNTEIYIPNYTSSNNKSISVDAVSENNATTAIAALTAGLWSNSAAITSITITPAVGNIDANSTFSLYGIAALGTTPTIAPKAYGGNRIDNDGTYWYHTFTSSGTFTPQVGLTADCLVIAGGGGGGAHFGGGGGAGGLLGFVGQSLTGSTGYAVAIGAGGAGGLYATAPYYGALGSDSQFSTLTLVKGGGGGATRDRIALGQNGGSGGGGTEGGAGGTATSGQGFAGGTGNNSAPAYCGGGGGGATAVGVAGTSTVAGNGGAGSSAYSSWATATSTGSSGAYAGGGGGGTGIGGYTQGTGGAGGGGNGGGTNPGAVNTGSGGGGFASVGTGGAGGSGIIIVRYPIA
jgi:hypothetical protein